MPFNSQSIPLTCCTADLYNECSNLCGAERVFSSCLIAHVVRENTAQRGTGIENGSEWSNGTVHFERTGPTEKSGPPREGGRYFRNFSGWTKPFHSVLDRNFRKFWLNGKRPRISLTRLSFTSARRQKIWVRGQLLA